MSTDRGVAQLLSGAKSWKRGSSGRCSRRKISLCRAVSSLRWAMVPWGLRGVTRCRRSSSSRTLRQVSASSTSTTRMRSSAASGFVEALVAFGDVSGRQRLVEGAEQEPAVEEDLPGHGGAVDAQLAGRGGA